ncbi:MFS transporter [Intrasporangium oryzae NRRL B-24470]|uniref:MFS transporter n=1 Tax=Intrasporangium oryzae NRRL B-24470 TaxID=1386089 RepID=W9G753_9MICO|nr:MFS transporter [Intrasporangium oryzae]EWT01986.1 MFS transporter [Intrasporangium oryzae NRRL B-24470]
MTDTRTNRDLAAPAHPTAILAIILVSYFMILLDNSIIFTGLPTIGAAMDLSPVGLSWVQDAYTLVFGGLLLLGARLGDLLGRRRVFVAGLAVFALASLLVACAPNGAFLIAARALQGVLGYSALQAGVAFFPMTVVNFVVAVAIPRLTRRLGNATLLAAGVLLTLLGMAWLSRVGASSDYLTAVAAPMMLIGAGQGLAFAPLTSAGISGVRPDDAGAASGLVNTAHQLGSALGLGILVAVAATVSGSTDTVAGLAAHVSTALTAGSVLLALALVVTVALVLPSGVTEHRLARSADNGYAKGKEPADEWAPGSADETTRQSARTAALADTH